jgi:hypothetical protein
VPRGGGGIWQLAQPHLLGPGRTRQHMTSWQKTCLQWRQQMVSGLIQQHVSGFRSNEGGYQEAWCGSRVDLKFQWA